MECKKTRVTTTRSPPSSGNSSDESNRSNRISKLSKHFRGSKGPRPKQDQDKESKTDNQKSELSKYSIETLWQEHQALKQHYTKECQEMKDKCEKLEIENTRLMSLCVSMRVTDIDRRGGQDFFSMEKKLKASLNKSKDVENLASAQLQIKRLQTRVSQLEEREKQHVKMIDNLKSQVDVLKAEKIKASDSCCIEKGKVVDLKTKLNAATAEVRQQELRKKQQEIRHKKEVDDLKFKIRTSEDKVRNFKRDLNLLMMHISEPRMLKEKIMGLKKCYIDHDGKKQAVYTDLVMEVETLRSENRELQFELFRANDVFMLQKYRECEKAGLLSQRFINQFEGKEICRKDEDLEFFAIPVTEKVKRKTNLLSQ